MFQTLTFYHSLLRWLVLLSLILGIIRAIRSYSRKLSFTQTDKLFRSVTTSIAHLQLVAGILVYTQSPAINYFWKNLSSASENPDLVFFAVIHAMLMLTAITLLSIGSALSARKTKDPDKFKTIIYWYALTLLLVLIAIPWPFSPFAQRPYFR